MKKLILSFLLLAGTGTVLHAQYALPNQYESVFDSPKPARSNALFTFILADGRRVLMECSYISQVMYIPNPDSLLKVAVETLAPLKDSLRADGMVRRVDIVLGNNEPKIRILSHPEFSNAYTVKDNELMQLKMNQDTVRITVMTKSNRKYKFDNGSGRADEMYTPAYPFTITLFVNNAGDIAGIPPGTLSQCLDVLKARVERYAEWDTKNYALGSYRASFNMKTGKMFSPANIRYIPNQRQQGFSPVIGFGFTAVRGAFSPIAQVGLEYTRSNAYFINKWGLYLEGQAFFSRDSAKNLSNDRHTFAVFQFRQFEKAADENKMRLIPNLSVGYLIARSGNWYEKNTFRLGLPQFANKHISVEPQFVFNGFFKNVTIGLRFCFNF